MKFEFPNTPVSTLPILAKQLEAFGAKVTFTTPTHGTVDSIAGRLGFTHSPANILTIWVAEDAGHFAPRLLVGGIKQMVGEAREIALKGATA
jgi:hypothetical protein